MTFYTNVQQIGNFIYERGYRDGIPFSRKVKYKPTLYIPCQEESEKKTLEGYNVTEYKCEDIREARDFVKKYQHVDNFDFFGMTQYQYTYINENYRQDFEYNFEDIHILNIDIETWYEDEFPEPDKAEHEITAITAYSNSDNTHHVFGMVDFKVPANDVVYYKCKNEVELLTKFVTFWKKFNPDIVTGWNIEFFDIPYIVNRLKRLFGDDAAKKLSPWNRLSERVMTYRGKDYVIYDPSGIAILDYLTLYKRYTYNERESYRLDYIGHVELGERKLDYSEYGNLKELYIKNPQLFFEYNIRDVALINKLDDRLKLLQLAAMIAYYAKVNFNDIHSQVRMWDVIIHNYLLNEMNVVVPQKVSTSKNVQYQGAYVKNPQLGFHNWIVSFDLTSLYPMLIQEFNVGPDTMIPDTSYNIPIRDLIAGKLDYKIHKELLNKNMTLSANGYCFDKSKQSFLSKLMDDMFTRRNTAKKKMIAYQKELELVKTEMSKRGLKS